MAGRLALWATGARECGLAAMALMLMPDSMFAAGGVGSGFDDEAHHPLVAFSEEHGAVWPCRGTGRIS